ncbi:MAG: mechanosensitive ion channel family protein, partial [Gammaproteobacteria bacterium]
MEASVLSQLGQWAYATADALLLVTWLFAASGMLLHFAPHTKRTLGSMWLLLIASAATFFLAHVLKSTDAAEAGHLLGEVCVLFAGIAIIRITTLFAFHYLLPRLGLSPPRIVEDLVSVAAYVAFGLIRLRYAGLELSQIVTTSAVLTGVVAFSMQDTLGNILGGIALQLDNSLRIGEWIKVGDINGKITEIRWRSTEIETRNWETIVVPNSVLMRGEFIVLGRRKDQPEQWRRWVWFNVGYESAPSEVISVVNNAIRHADIKNVA